jgi:hypothetical protein
MTIFLAQLAEFFHGHAALGQFIHEGVAVALEALPNDAVDVVIDVLALDDAADLTELSQQNLAFDQRLDGALAQDGDFLFDACRVIAMLELNDLLLRLDGLFHFGRGDGNAVNDGSNGKSLGQSAGAGGGGKKDKQAEAQRNHGK